MNYGALRGLMRMQGLSQTDVARMAGVTRQAVSLWFRQAEGEGENALLDIRTPHLVALARNAGVSVDDLVDDLPLVDDAEGTAEIKSELLWDRLYPGPIEFAAALARREPVAVARLVGARGMYAAAAILGEHVWIAFDDYKRHLHPVRRKECERLWELRRNPPRN